MLTMRLSILLRLLITLAYIYAVLNSLMTLFILVTAIWLVVPASILGGAHWMDAISSLADACKRQPKGSHHQGDPPI